MQSIKYKKAPVKNGQSCKVNSPSFFLIIVMTTISFYNNNMDNPLILSFILIFIFVAFTLRWQFNAKHIGRNKMGFYKETRKQLYIAIGLSLLIASISSLGGGFPFHNPTVNAQNAFINISYFLINFFFLFCIFYTVFCYITVSKKK